jgi:hypothetical protein
MTTPKQLSYQKTVYITNEKGNTSKLKLFVPLLTNPEGVEVDEKAVLGVEKGDVFHKVYQPRAGSDDWRLIGVFNYTLKLEDTLWFDIQIDRPSGRRLCWAGMGDAYFLVFNGTRIFAAEWMYLSEEEEKKFPETDGCWFGYRDDSGKKIPYMTITHWASIFHPPAPKKKSS